MLLETIIEQVFFCAFGGKSDHHLPLFSSRTLAEQRCKDVEGGVFFLKKKKKKKKGVRCVGCEIVRVVD